MPVGSGGGGLEPRPTYPADDPNFATDNSWKVSNSYAISISSGPKIYF